MIDTLNIIAHPDDDLWFMNPVLAEAIASGETSTTVVLTAGEIGGAGSTDGERARSRQRGLMDAYAAMAGLAPAGDQSEWQAWTYTAAGRVFDHYSLTGRDVSVVFLGCPDSQLWTVDSGATLTSVPATGAPTTQTQTYDRATLVAVVAALIQAADPATIRTLDVAPDTRVVSDHGDHVTSARIARDAARDSGSPAAVVGYRCYSLSVCPSNLDATTAAAKRDVAARYMAYDPAADVGPYAARMRHRWPLGSQWAARDAAGRLVAAAVRRGRLWLWRHDGTLWQPPIDLGNPGVDLAPGPCVSRNADGRIEVFGRTIDHRIVSRYQVPSGGWSAGWADFGSHNPGSPLMGSPIVATNADGRQQLFVRNAGGGVSSRYQKAVNGGWSGWLDLGGYDVQDGLAAARTLDGRIELFAPTRTAILHWYQTAANNGWKVGAGWSTPAPASELSAAAGPDGRIRIAYRATGGGLATITQTGPGNGWGQPETSPSLPGYGPPVLASDWAVHTASDHMAVAVSGADLLAVGWSGTIYHRVPSGWAALP